MTSCELPVASGELNCDAALPIEPASDSQLVIVISASGSLTFVWDDDLLPLFDLGRSQISRASHVEPTAVGLWTADMAPSGGPVLGPFTFRREALNAEREWLRDHRGL